jgi:uncharacterized protein YndB with AHSA1/START domain
MNMLGLVLLANITASSPDGFVSEHVLDVRGTPAEVYAALTDDVSRWWDAAHSYTGDAHNFSMDARAGGCFCEDFPNGVSVQHMRVLYADPGRYLRMEGGLGPLQPIPLTGVMDFELMATEQGSRLTFRYSVHGPASAGIEGMAAPVDAVLLGQLKRLQAYVEGDAGTRGR